MDSFKFSGKTEQNFCLQKKKELAVKLWENPNKIADFFLYVWWIMLKYA